MNARKQIFNILGLGSLLALAISLSPSVVRAGTAPTHGGKASIPASAAVAPSDVAAMACAGCKTVDVTERRILPGAKAGTAIFSVGSKHECAMCGGEIAAVNGTVTDTMLHDCTVCASTPAPCCAPSAETKKG